MFIFSGWYNGLHVRNAQGCPKVWHSVLTYFSIAVVLSDMKQSNTLHHCFKTFLCINPQQYFLCLIWQCVAQASIALMFYKNFFFFISSGLTIMKSMLLIQIFSPSSYVDSGYVILESTSELKGHRPAWTYISFFRGRACTHTPYWHIMKQKLSYHTLLSTPYFWLEWRDKEKG